MRIDIGQDVSLALIAAICGLAFPIIIHTIGQIDTKYGSTRLIERIKRSWQFYFFIVLLICAIITRIYYCFAPVRSVDLGALNNFTDNSALGMLYFILLLLITSLFLFTFLVIRYYSPTKLLKDISEKMIKKVKDKEPLVSKNTNSELYPKESKAERHFKDWTDLVISVITSPNYDTVSRTVNTAYQSLYNYVVGHNKSLAYKESIYPFYFYNSIRSINKAICAQEPQLSSAHNSNIVVKIFIDDFQKTRISAQSYSCIWLCLSEQLFHNRTDLIIEYWGAAYQHYSMFLQRLTEGYIEDIGMKIELTVTKENVKNRDIDRKQFKLFNCVLGALLLYHGKYILLNDIFRFKNSTYESDSLLPDDYREIIDLYLELNNFDLTDPFWIERQYPFINIRGVNSNNEIKFCIEKYLAILLIRVERLEAIDGRHRHTEMPQIPRTLSNIAYYKENLTNLKQTTLAVCQDGIPQNIDSNFASDPLIIKKLDSFLTELDNEYDRIKKEQEMDDALLEAFYQSVNNYYNGFKSKMHAVCNKQIGNTPRPYNCELKYETRRFEDKGLYCINQDIGRGGFDSVFASTIVCNLEYELGHKLLSHTKRSLVCKYDDLFAVIDRLNIDENYVIITNKIEFEYFIGKQIKITCKDEECSEFLYNNINIFNFNHLQNTYPCIWILKKSELPTVSFEEEPDNKRYVNNMKSFEGGLFINIIDLYRNKEIRDGINDDPYSDLDSKILIWIECNMKLHYVDNGKILRISLLPPYVDGEFMELNSVNPFTEYF